MLFVAAAACLIRRKWSLLDKRNDQQLEHQQEQSQCAYHSQPLEQRDEMRRKENESRVRTMKE